MMRRTKIVCTLGPASYDTATIRNLVRTGMDVARLNFSHGTHADHDRTYRAVREIAEAEGENVAILMDLQGPKIRTGPLVNGEAVELVEDASLILTTTAAEGTAARISTTYQNLPHDVHPGDRILIADGVLELRVTRVEAPDVETVVVRGGMLGQHKGINLPRVNIAEPSLTEKDREDLRFGLALGVDYVALSFVREPKDIEDLRREIDAVESDAGIVAKIERPEALDHFDDIVAITDAIMVARGDLGVEIPFEEVPAIQKRLIKTCNEAGVPVITATQMLESMVSYIRPTRAEVTDVANAIYDGTDAVMLSAETAAGQNPVEACRVMARVAERADTDMIFAPSAERLVRVRHNEARRGESKRAARGRMNVFADAIGQAVYRMAETLDVAQIVCFTSSGYTAAALSRYRPRKPIVALTPNEGTMRRCALLWGMRALATPDFGDIDEMLAYVETLLRDNHLAKSGDTVIIVAGTPLVVSGRTNLLKLHTIGDPV